MFFKRILSPSLMAWSYVLGDDGKALVIDPRRDYAIYLQEAAKAGLEIHWVAETHRHEDQISGAKGLAEACGVDALYSRYEDLGQKFGRAIGEEDVFVISERLRVLPLHTPGHTLGHLCYLVEYEGRPWILFTGDTLFYGGVGRSDFYGEENLEKMTALLYDTIYKKLKPLGQDIIIYPGHAAGSACGNNLDDMEISTLGRELAQNKALSKDRDDFMKKNARMHYKNPAFNEIEDWNIRGAGEAHREEVKVFSDAEGLQVVDARDMLAFSGAHLPGSILVPAELTASYAGWLLPTDQPFLLLVDQLSEDMRELALDSYYRMGFRCQGILPAGTLRKKEMKGETIHHLERIQASHYLAWDEDMITLDVRLPEEYSETDPIQNRIPIPLQELRDRLHEVPKKGKLFLLCGSGERASMAASLFPRERKATVIIGGIQALRIAAEEK